jgi:hypothetical protein
MTDDDKLVELIAREADGERLTRAERSILNKAKWAASKENAVVVKPERMPVGTPKGNKQRVAEFKEMLLSPVRGANVINKVYEIAMNDEHPGQTNALKMCMDRMLPTSIFEEKKDGSRVAVTISISGIGEPTVIDNDSGEIDEARSS